MEETPSTSLHWNKVILVKEDHDDWRVIDQFGNRDSVQVSLTWHGIATCRVNDHFIKNLDSLDTRLYGIKHYWRVWFKYSGDDDLEGKRSGDQEHLGDAETESAPPQEKQLSSPDPRNDDDSDAQQGGESFPSQEELVGRSTDDEGGVDSSGPSLPRTPRTNDERAATSRPPQLHNQFEIDQAALFKNNDFVNAIKKMRRGEDETSYPLIPDQLTPKDTSLPGGLSFQFQPRVSSSIGNPDGNDPINPDEELESPPPTLPPINHDEGLEPPPPAIPPMNLNDYAVLDDQYCTESAIKAMRKIKRICSSEGCTNNAQTGGVCKRHGAKVSRKNCSAEGCANNVVNGGVCIRHGAKVSRKNCSAEGCTNKIVNGGVCTQHGAKRRICSSEGCATIAVNGGVCIRHGAKVSRKNCSAEGCTNNAVNGGVCKRHGAKRRICSSEGCTNNAVNGGVCKRHGAESSSAKRKGGKDENSKKKKKKK
eukprot:scaffold12291_cov133-Skeletonema_marinoi.AAC.3